VVKEIGPTSALLRRVFDLQPGRTQRDVADAIHVYLVSARTAQGAASRMALPERDGLVIFTANVLPPDFAIAETRAATAPASWRIFSPPAALAAGEPSALTVEDGRPITIAATVRKCRVVQRRRSGT